MKLLKLLGLTPVLGLEQELANEIELKKDELTHFHFEIDFNQPQLVLILTDAPLEKLSFYWVSFFWGEVMKAPINSISNAASALQTIGKKWKHLSVNNHRRGELIEKQLNTALIKPLVFPNRPNHPSSHTFALLSEKELIYSLNPHLFPTGELSFEQNHKDPPSRAYLKLWEFFTLYAPPPKASELCIDMGSCPGGWTWVLTELNCPVISVDKATIDPKLISNPLVSFRQESAFGLKPSSVSPNLKWFFSDIICYPQKLYELVTLWREARPELNFVCTIKFQAETDFKAIKNFEAISNSQIIHLAHNKHELTWACIKNL